MSCGKAVLCGFISRFQLLSPGTGQVAHALLTRPPLSLLMILAEASIGEQTPFDLHVLGTPPAFILSQDQTLMLKFVLCRINASLLSKLLLCPYFYCVLGLT